MNGEEKGHLLRTISFNSQLRRLTVLKISFFANYTKLTRKLNQAYMQFNMQSHHKSYCILIERLKSSLSIKIDLVQSSICRIKLVLYLPSEYYSHRLQQNNQANGQRDYTLSVPNNSCLLLLWLVGLVENNYSCKYFDWKGPPFYFSFLECPWSGPGSNQERWPEIQKAHLLPLRYLGGVLDGVLVPVNRSSAFSIPFFASPWKTSGGHI